MQPGSGGGCCSDATGRLVAPSRGVAAFEAESVGRVVVGLVGQQVIDGSAEQLSGSGSPARNARTVARPCGVAW